MKKEKGKIFHKLFTCSYLSEETIRKAVIGEEHVINCVIQKYKGYVRCIIKKKARKEGVRLDKTLLDEIEQQVWKGLIEDIKKFKI